MKVSSGNNFENFKILPANTENKTAQGYTTSIRAEDKSPLETVSQAAVSPGGIGGLFAAALTVAGAVKYRKNIGKFVKNIFKSTESSTEKTKEHVKKVYNEYLNRDIIQENIDDITKTTFDKITGTTRSISAAFPEDTKYGWANGVLYYGPDCKAKEKAIEDLIKFLEKQGWDIERVPVFDVTKAEETMKRDGYCYDYVIKLMQIFIKSAEKYKKTGKRTAIVLRHLDTFTEKRQSHGEGQIYRMKTEFVDRLLDPVENLKKNGCTWITDSVSLENMDTALGRFGRIDRKVLIRPLPEDSKAAWDEYLEASYKSYEYIKEKQAEMHTCRVNGKINWRMQNAIDTYPERYRASSELYQKLKDTKYYPFEL